MKLIKQNFFLFQLKIQTNAHLQIKNSSSPIFVDCQPFHGSTSRRFLTAFFRVNFVHNFLFLTEKFYSVSR
jgi:hypothetical protein